MTGPVRARPKFIPSPVMPLSTPPMRATFRKHERLTGRDRLKQVATTGKAINSPPFRLVGLLMPLDTVAPAQIAFAIPKRHLRLAVHRNRMRRMMREVYRLDKQRWYTAFRAADVQCAWLLIYQGKATIGWEEVQQKITALLDRWVQQHVHSSK